MNNVDIEALEKKILDLFTEYEVDELGPEYISDNLSPYELLLLICFVGDMKSIKFELVGKDTNLYRYNNEAYKIPVIKILRKGEK